MANWCLLLPIVLAIIAQTITARDVPGETNKHVDGLTDQKNVFTFAGLGGFAGLDNNGQPIGGGGIGVGVGVGIGNANAIGGVSVGYGLGRAANGLGTVAGSENGFGGVPAVGGEGLGDGDDGGEVPLP